MRLALIAAAAAAALVAAGGAYAITLTTSTTATTAVTLNGDDQVGTFTLTLTLKTTGNAGWNVTAWAPAPTGTSGTLSPLTVTAEPVPSCGNGKCNVSVPAAPVDGYAYPYPIGTTAGAATKIWNADVGTGNNKNQYVDVVFGTPVAANEFAGTYTTTLTLTASSTGP